MTKPLWYWPLATVVFPMAFVIGGVMAVVALGLGGAVAVGALGAGAFLSPWLMTRHGQKKLAAAQKYLAEKSAKLRE
jgi:hypothetical protein